MAGLSFGVVSMIALILVGSVEARNVADITQKTVISYFIYVLFFSSSSSGVICLN